MDPGTSAGGGSDGRAASKDPSRTEYFALLPPALEAIESKIQWSNARGILLKSGWGGGAGSSFVFRNARRRVRATFTVSGPADNREGWEVRRFELTDPTGNVSYAASILWRMSASGERQLVCETLPLWPDDPAWRIRLDLVRAPPYPSNRVLRLLPIAFPSKEVDDAIVLRTDFLGRIMTVHARLATIPPMPNESSAFVSLGASLRFKLDGVGDDSPAAGNQDPMLRLIEVRDSVGSRMEDVTLYPDILAPPAPWRLEFRRQPVGVLEVTLAAPEERLFEFLVDSRAGWSQFDRVSDAVSDKGTAEAH